MKKQTIGLPAIVVSAVMAASLVFTTPDSAGAVTTSGGRGGVELGSITVTAEKQEENVQDVSTSITVMDEFAIEDRNLASVMDIVDHVPNMMGFNDGMLTYNRISTRGLAAPIYANHTTSTGMYVDGVPVLGPAGYEEGIIDIERIEVLRGPQGTLYGKNTESGAINIITRKPTNHFQARVFADTGRLLSSWSHDRKAMGAGMSMSGPITKDRLFFNLAGVFDHKDGFIQNITRGEPVYEQERWSGRAKLRWKPWDRLDISLLTSYLSHRADGGMNMNLTDTGAAKFRLPSPQYRVVASNLDERQDMVIDAQSLNLSYEMGEDLTLTSVTARRVSNYDCVLDFDFSPMSLMDGSQDNTLEKISQEIRLGNRGKGRWEWLVGLYYDRDDNLTRTWIRSMVPSMASFSHVRLTGDAYAVFGRVGFALTPQLKLMGGLRYEKQEMALESNASSRLEETWEKLSPKIALEYRLSPQVMVYANITQGYRPGGFNHLATDPAYYSYDEETLWSYEIGVKSLMMNKRIMTNAAAFYMDISDMQVSEAVDPFRAWNTNAAQAVSKGVELEVTARVFSGLTLNGGFGVTQIEFDSFSDAKGNYQGNKVPYAPEYNFNLGAQYRHGSGFYARADLIGYGKMFMDNTNVHARDAYHVVNARVGFETPNLDIYCYGKNIFDKQYDAPGYFGGFYTLYSDPGEMGLQAVYRF